MRRTLVQFLVMVGLVFHFNSFFFSFFFLFYFHFTNDNSVDLEVHIKRAGFKLEISSLVPSPFYFFKLHI